MRKSLRRACHATAYLIRSTGSAVAADGFLCFLLLVIACTPLLGLRALPKMTPAGRRIAASKQREAARWIRSDRSGSPEDAPSREPARAADLRWMALQNLYAPAVLLALPLWPIALTVDGMWCGLLRRDPVALPLISRIADMEARRSLALLSGDGRGGPSGADLELVEEVRALAAAGELDVSVRTGDWEPSGAEISAPMAAALRFAVRQALDDAAERSTGGGATAELERNREGLRLVVWDEGIGGVDESHAAPAATQRQVAGVDGVVTVVSPVGGPTMVAVEVPVDNSPSERLLTAGS